MSPVLVPAATEAQWLAARRTGVTASEIACVMGLAPTDWDSPYSLYHRKLGLIPPKDPDSDELERGRILEPYIAGRFARLRPEFHVAGDGRQLFAHPERGWQLATPDRIVNEVATVGTCTCYGGDTVYGYEPRCGLELAGPVAVLECKSDAGDGWGDDGTDDIPVHVRCQVLWQMDVMGVTTAYVVCLLMRSWKIRVYEISLDEQAREDLELMRLEAELFLDRMARRDPPDVDWRPQTTAALKRLHPDVADVDVAVRRMPVIRYEAACRAYTAAERRKKEAENRLRLLLGSGRRIIDGRTGRVVARRDVYDVKAHTRKASHVDKLVPIPVKPEKDQT